MRVFDFEDYRKFLTDWLASMPNRGYGKLAQIAKALDISPSIVTLVLKGSKDFTLEQGNDLAEYLGLSDLETEYFLALLNHARAGKENLRRRYKRHAERLKVQAEKLKERMPANIEMTDEAKSIFYSQWYYSAIRILSSIEGFNTADELAARLNIPRAKVNRVIDFLLQYRLCVLKNNKVHMGPQSTHLGSDSPLVSRHHINWRERAIQQLDNMKSDELFFTSPVSIATKDIPAIRKILMEAIEDCFKIIDPSECEEALCLNLDWFRF